MFVYLFVLLYVYSASFLKAYDPDSIMVPCRYIYVTFFVFIYFSFNKIVFNATNAHAVRLKLVEG